MDFPDIEELLWCTKHNIAFLKGRKCPFCEQQDGKVMKIQDLLKPEEITVLDILAEAWNQFIAMPQLHQWDRLEFMHVIHSAQQMIMCRPVQRTFKTDRPIGNKPDPLEDDEETTLRYTKFVSEQTEEL